MNRLNYRRVSIGFVIVAAAIFANAQSGRRGTTGSTASTPSVSGSKTVEKTPVKPLKTQLLVSIDDRNANFRSNVPYYIVDSVVEICLRRLNEASDINAVGAGQHMTRGDAVKAAKEEKDRFVVWLEIGSDQYDSGRQSTTDTTDSLYVRYTILEPGTAKSKQSGRTHHGIYQAGGIGVGNPQGRNSPRYSDYALKQSAKEAADRILTFFDIKLKD